MKRERIALRARLARVVDGPICRELREGSNRIAVEARRMARRVAVQLQIRALYREWDRATRDLQWRRKDLCWAEDNYMGLEAMYQARHEKLTRRLQSLQGGLQ